MRTILFALALTGCGLTGPDYVYEGSPEYRALCHFTWYASRETQRQAMERVSEKAWLRCRPNLTMTVVIDLEG